MSKKTRALNKEEYRLIIDCIKNIIPYIKKNSIPLQCYSFFA